MLSNKLVILTSIIMLLGSLVGCSSALRGPLQFSGTVSTENGQALPDNLSLFIIEERSDHSAFGTALLPLAEIPVSADGSFSYRGDTCENVQLLVPYTKFGVGGKRDDPIWKSEIRIELNSELIELDASSNMANTWQKMREDAKEFERLDAEKAQPC